MWNTTGYERLDGTHIPISAPNVDGKVDYFIVENIATLLDFKVWLKQILIFLMIQQKTF